MKEISELVNEETMYTSKKSHEPITFLGSYTFDYV